jgi:ABC-type uncharacterized transport system substrate-binding protein
LVGPEFGENTHQHEGFLALPTEHGCTDPVYYNFLQRNDASKVSTKAIFASRSGELAALAVRYAVPTVCANRGFAMAGGLVSYGSDIVCAYRLTGGYVGRILKGEKSADLPVQQATKVESRINLKAAKALGVTVPLTLLGRADEVIDAPPHLCRDGATAIGCCYR